MEAGAVVSLLSSDDESDAGAQRSFTPRREERLEVVNLVSASAKKKTTAFSSPSLAPMSPVLFQAAALASRSSSRSPPPLFLPSPNKTIAVDPPSKEKSLDSDSDSDDGDLFSLVITKRATTTSSTSMPSSSSSSSSTSSHLSRSLRLSCSVSTLQRSNSYDALPSSQPNAIERHALRKSRTEESGLATGRKREREGGVQADSSLVPVVDHRKRRKEEARVAAALKRSRALEERVGRQVQSGKFVTREVRVMVEARFAGSEECKDIFGAFIANDIDFDTIKLKTPGMIYFVHQQFLKPENHINPVAVVVNNENNTPVLDPDDPGSLLSNAVLLVFSSEDFVDHMLQEDFDNSLRMKVEGAIEEWCEMRLKHRQSARSKETPKVIIVLSGVREAINARLKYLRKNKKTIPGAERLIKNCTLERLTWVLDWLLVACACESRVVGPSNEELAETVSSLTLGLLNAIHYRKPNELEVMAHYKKFGVARNKLLDDESGVEEGKNPKVGMRRNEITSTWINQLQCLMSEKKAFAVAQHFPTFRSLMYKYLSDSLTLEEKESLIQNIFGDRSSSVKLSRDLFRYMTTLDPSLVIKG